MGKIIKANRYRKGSTDAELGELMVTVGSPSQFLKAIRIFTLKSHCED